MRPFDANGVFIAGAPEGGSTLRRLAVRGAGMTVFSGVVSLAIQVVATVVLARLLTPRDFGLVAMVTTFSLLLSNFGINGITEAIVQRERIDSALAGNLFWINLGGGALLTAGFAAAGPVLAKFYGDPRVVPITAGIAASILLTSPSVVHLALLKRAMCFPAVAKNDIVAKAATVVVSIAFARAGFGYWALVLGICATALSTTAGAWIMCRWIPGLPRGAQGTGAMMKFAMYTYGRFTVNYFARNTDNLLVGWRFGAVSLGFYKKAYDLFSLSAAQLVSATSVVAVSALSRVRQDSVQYRRYLLAAMGVMALAGMGIAGDLMLVGKDVIRALLGPGWERAGRIFTFFAPGIGIMMVYGTHGWIHLSLGRADRWFRWGIVEWAITILLFLGGLHWGPEGIAIAWCVSFWVLTAPALKYAGKPIGFGIGPVIEVVWRYVVAASLAYGAIHAVLARFDMLVPAHSTGEAALRGVLVSLGFVVFYVGVIVALYRGWAPILQLAGLLREMALPVRASTGTAVEHARSVTLILVALLATTIVAGGRCGAQTSPSLEGKFANRWADAGVGRIPERPVKCTSLTNSATVNEINAALAKCPGGETVYLDAGTYEIDGTVHVPSNVTLRGAGADRTILKATGRNGGDVISMGSGSVAFRPVKVVSGSGDGSMHIEVSNTSSIHAGMYLVVTETNDPRCVSSEGSGGNCNWCDGWTKDGSMARGQIVKVTGVIGRLIAIAPGLYGAYTHSPIAVPFEMSAEYAGVEDLQVYASGSGYAANFGMAECAYCWIKGVESNYADGDHVEVYWGYHDEVRDSYFSNAFRHEPGRYDSDLQLAFKTTASLVENNIIERTHTAVMLEWGAAGNVIAYNYSTGEFDSRATNLDIGGIDFHGAHPQFNLLEGNVVTQIAEDPVWGTSSHTTAYRNWVVGTNRICEPMNGRGAVHCDGNRGHYGFQAARAIELSYLTTADRYIANVVGSREMQSLMGYSSPLQQKVRTEYPEPRSYDAVAYGWSIGYGSTSDDGAGTGCGGGIPPCHRTEVARADFFDGNYNNVSGTIEWAAGVKHGLQPSLYLTAKPAWWGSMPFPAIGPDVAGGSGGGGHSYGNPARTCYLQVMRGVDGGANGPLSFNAKQCYGEE